MRRAAELSFSRLCRNLVSRLDFEPLTVRRFIDFPWQFRLDLPPETIRNPWIFKDFQWIFTDFQWIFMDVLRCRAAC